jgi:hypothetical protein
VLKAKSIYGSINGRDSRDSRDGRDSRNIDRGLKKLVAIFAQLLCLIHGGICLVENFLHRFTARIFAVSGVDADADAGRNRHDSTIEHEALIQSLQNFLGDAADILQADNAGQNRDKFIATQAGNDIAIAEAVGEALCHGFEQQVANLMTIDIVDLLKTVCDSAN